jgi:uncharacterized protein CbrC (UPF0167 family)
MASSTFSQSKSLYGVQNMVFKNGVAIHTWKNLVGIDHIFIAERSGQCVYGGYVGWSDAKYLQESLQNLCDEFEGYAV